MQLSQIKNFIHVIEQQSFSRAAAVVRIAQPALSRQIKLLEDELGTALLVRHGWGVTATEAGQAFLEHARLVVHEIEAGRDAVKAVQVEPAGRLIFGAPTALALLMYPSLANEFIDNHPKVQLQLKSGSSAFIHQAAVTGDLDVAVLYEERVPTQLRCSPLLEEDIVLVGPPGSLDPAQPLGMNDLEKLPFVFAAPPTLLRLMIDSFQQRNDIHLRVVLEVDLYPALLTVLPSCRAYTLLPFSGAQTAVAEGALSWCPLHGVDLKRRLVLARPIGRTPNAATEIIERKVRQFVWNNTSSARWRPLFRFGEEA